MKVNKGERSVLRTDFVHHPSPFLHPAKVKEVKRQYPLYIDTFSLYIYFFPYPTPTPAQCALLAVRTHEGVGEGRKRKEVNRYFPARASPDGIGNSRAHRQTFFRLSGFFQGKENSLTRIRMETR